jgi:hypothetical protein
MLYKYAQELVPTHMKRSQESIKFHEGLMGVHAMRKAMTTNTSHAHRKGTS